MPAAAPSSPPRSEALYVVGIDLGTSHTVVAYAPLGAGTDAIDCLALPQRISASEVQALTLLPSVRYQAAVGELGEAWQQPWPPASSSAASPAVVGRWAQDLGAAVPHRLVSSAKSWLSHSGVDRTAAILPWGAADGEVEKISPLQASASYLAHVRAAWDQAHPEAPLDQQLLVLTVPASFDEGARALTLEAAALAGLGGVQLLEEPKAAFYDWLALQGPGLAGALAQSRVVLVVDVGGGTTDLTLIRVEPAAGAGLPVLTRIAVGEHLMLGGDNMDLALALQLEPQLAPPGERLGAAKFAQLVQRCRSAKERLLAADAPEAVTITLLGSGSRLLAQSRSAELQRSQVQALVVDGFLPWAELADSPQKRHSGLRGFGLPYPADAAISRHLAQFLRQHGELPDSLLLNGGVFHAAALGQRLTEMLAGWRDSPLRRLSNPHPDAAVARGAAVFGLGLQPAATTPNAAIPQIGGGSARSYWLQLPGQPPQAICVLPRGTPEGRPVQLEGRRFELRLGRAVRFGLLACSHGQEPAGALTEVGDRQGWVELPPLTAVLPAGGSQARVEVVLQALMTEVGTLEMRCVAVADPEQRWQLAFALRGAAAAPDGSAETADPLAERLDQALALIDRIFGPQAQEVTAKEVRQLRAGLEKIVGPRAGWPLPLLRALFDGLLARAKRRRRSADHERVWLNLAGWCLRPGLGAELDDWRLEQVWALHAQGLAHPKEAANWTEWWVFWRRVAAGLNADRQLELLEEVAGCMQTTVQQSTQRQGGRAAYGSYDDMLRLFAAMEAVPWQYRQEMGEWMLQRLRKPGESVQTWWAIGRLAGRQPLAANAHLVMPPEAAEPFLQATLAQDWRHNQTAMFAAVQIARMTGDRGRDLSEAQRAQVLAKLEQARAPERWISLVDSLQVLDAEEQQRSLGDSLPPGLVLL